MRYETATSGSRDALAFGFSLVGAATVRVRLESGPLAPAALETWTEYLADYESIRDQLFAKFRSGARADFPTPFADLALQFRERFGAKSLDEASYETIKYGSWIESVARSANHRPVKRFTNGYGGNAHEPNPRASR